MSVAPSGARNVDAAPSPTAHAVGYILPPLRGFPVQTESEAEKDELKLDEVADQK
jgi:hypothetical protein